MARSDAKEIRSALSKAVSAGLELRTLGYGRLGARERAARLAGYRDTDLEGVPRETIELSSGCGNPLSECTPTRGQTVLDIGSGGGLDLIIAASLIGAEGQVMGVDMNADINALAMSSINATALKNVEISQGFAEALPVDDMSIDLVTANGLIALSPERGSVLSEIHRVLSPGGFTAIADVVVHDLPTWAHASRGLYHAGITGAYDLDGLTKALADAGFLNVQVRRHEVLDTDRLETFIDGGLAGIEVAGCSASGAIMGSEAAAALTGHVALATVLAQKPTVE